MTIDLLLDTPALPLLLSLERAGFDLEVTDDGLLRISPRNRLDEEHVAAIRRHKDALKLLVRSCDDGVQARVAVFKGQLASTPAPSAPAFLFKPDVPYTTAICFSCGDRLPQVHYGRCWRCSIAWRLAAGVSLDSDRARDEAKTTA